MRIQSRGSEGEQLSSKGYADEATLPKVNPNADRQKRLAILMSK